MGGVAFGGGWGPFGGLKADAPSRPGRPLRAVCRAPGLNAAAPRRHRAAPTWLNAPPAPCPLPLARGISYRWTAREWFCITEGLCKEWAAAGGARQALKLSEGPPELVRSPTRRAR